MSLASWFRGLFRRAPDPERHHISIPLRSEDAGYSSAAAFVDPHVSARARGLEVFEADDRTLMLDLDSAADMDRFWARLHVVEDNCRGMRRPWAGRYLVTVSASGEGRHVYLRLHEELPVAERVAWQGALGSDGKRDLLTLLRGYVRATRPPVVLFETDTEAARVREWMKDVA